MSLTPTLRRRLALVALLLALALLWSGRSRVVATLARHLLAPTVEAQFPGLTLRFRTLDTNLFSTLRLNGVVIDYCQAGECLGLRVAEAALTYPLSRLLSAAGTTPLLPLLRLDLAGVACEGEIPWSDSTSFLIPALPALPAITVADASLALKAGPATFNAQGLVLHAPSFAPAGETPYPVKLTARQVAVKAPGLPRRGGTLAATLSLRPGRLDIPELIFQEALLLDHGTLETNPQGLELGMNLHLLQSEGRVEGTIRQQEVSFTFHLTEGDLKTLAGAARVKPPVSGQLRADGEMAMTLGRPESLKGTITALVRDGSWDGATVDRLQVTARAREQHLDLETLELTMGGNTVVVREGRLPLPALLAEEWRQALAAGQGAARVEVTEPAAMPPAWTDLFLPDWQALALEAFKVDLTLQQGRLLVPAAEVAGGAGRARVTAGEVDLTASFADYEVLPCSFTWELALADAAVVNHFWPPWPASGGTARGQGSFSGTLHDPHLPFVATFQGSTLYGATLDQVTGRVEWRKDRLALDVTATNGKQDRLTFLGTIDLEQGGLINTQVSTDLDDVHPYLPKSLIGDAALSGSLSGEATLSGPFTRLTGTVEAGGDWTVEGVHLSGADLLADLSANKWSVRRLAGSLGQGVEVVAAGVVDPWAGPGRWAVDFTTLDLSSQGQALTLLAPGGGTISSRSIEVETPLLLAGRPGRFRLQGGLAGPAPLTLTAEEVADTGLLKEIAGRDIGFRTMGFTLALRGLLPHPEWHCQGAIQGLAVTGAPLSLAGRFDLGSDDRGLWLKEATLSGEDHSVTLFGHLPLAFSNRRPTLLAGPLELQARVALPRGGMLPSLFPEWLAASGALDAELDLSGTWDQPQGQVRLEADGLEPGPRLSTLPPGPFTVQGQMAVAKDRLSITGLDLTSTGLDLALSGTIAAVDWAGLIRGDGPTRPGQVEVTGRYAMPDLGWLAKKIPGVRRTAGSAGGAFTVRGPLTSPDLRADLTLTKGEARGSESLLVFRDITVNATLDHGQLTIATLEGSMGGAPLQGAGRVDGLFSADPLLDLTLSGKDLLLYRADGVKIRADTTLDLKGSLAAPELSGEIRSTDSRITRRVDWLSFLRPGGRDRGKTGFSLFSFKDPPLQNTRLNLRLRAARPLAIANNFFKGEVRPDLLLAGTGELPYLSGVIFADSGRITLPAGRLDLDNGLIRFAEGEPDRPQVEVQAAGRMMGYDITAQVEGAYDEPEVTLSSAPPLSSEELLMLLLAGRRPVSEGGSSGGVSTVAVYLGRGLLSRIFGEEVDQTLLLDRLEVDVGRAVTQQGEPTVDARMKLADGLWESDTSLYLTGEKDSWDYYNGGVRLVVHFR